MNYIISNLISIFVTAIVAFSLGHYVGGSTSFGNAFKEEVVDESEAAASELEETDSYISISNDEAWKYCSNFRYVHAYCGKEELQSALELDQETIEDLANGIEAINARYTGAKPEKFRVIYGYNPFAKELRPDAKEYRIVVLPVVGGKEDLTNTFISAKGLNSPFPSVKSEFLWKDGKDCKE